MPRPLGLATIWNGASWTASGSTWTPDILDPAVMPAVDSPDPGGIDHHELVAVLGTLLASARCVGFELTVFDPDLDPDGRLAHDLTGTVVAAFEQARPAAGAGIR